MVDDTARQWGRRECLQAIGTAVAIGSAGCIRSEEPTPQESNEATTFTETENKEIDADLEFRAATVAVNEQALSKVGYEERRALTHKRAEPYKVGNQSVTAEVVSHLVEYQRRVDLHESRDQEVARFAVLSTPQVDLGIQTFNPLNGITEETILEGLQPQYEAIQIGERIDSRSISVLEEDAPITKRRGTAVYRGTRIDLYLHLSHLLRDGDYMILVGVYPQLIDEEEVLLFLMEHTEYSG